MRNAWKKCGGFSKWAKGSWKKDAGSKADWKKGHSHNDDDDHQGANGWTGGNLLNWSRKDDGNTYSWKSVDRKLRDNDDEGCYVGRKHGWKKKAWAKNDDDGKHDWKTLGDCERKRKKRDCDDDDEPELPVCELPKQPDPLPLPPEPPADDNTAPVITAPNQTVEINFTDRGQIVTQVLATDDDADTLIFSINDATDPDSPDADLFLIDPDTGEIRATGLVSETGSVNGDSMYHIEVQVSDGQDVDTQIIDFVYFSAA